MSGVDPQGCGIFRFKQPNFDELGHDFLRRSVCRLPERGRIGIFSPSCTSRRPSSGATGTAFAPWHVMPADDKWNARSIVSQVLLDTLAQLRMSYPVPDKARRRKLASLRRQL